MSEKKKGGEKLPRSSREFNQRIEKNAGDRLRGSTQKGDHKSYDVETVDRTNVRQLTIIQGQRDLLDSNPKVYHKLIKAMRDLALLGIIIGPPVYLLKELIGGAIVHGEPGRSPTPSTPSGEKLG